MRVLVIESGRADDFYSQALDGPSTFQLLKLLGYAYFLGSAPEGPAGFSFETPSSFETDKPRT